VIYSDFIAAKAQSGALDGFDAIWLPDCLFDFQATLTETALAMGRSAIFADCGLGKTLMELVWGENVVRHTNRPVLDLTPLAVAAQTIIEAEKFGIDAQRSPDGRFAGKRIIVANYERLHYFNPADFGGVICDESSILKSFDGATRQAVTDFMRKVEYRLLCTATAAPNDYIELGTSSEALGYLGHMDMLNRFFKNDQNNSAVGRVYGEAVKWRFKGHAELPFWRWVCSWARACRKPSDLGFDDRQFVLPRLIEREHLVQTESIAPGMLFSLPAVGLKEQREERRRTLKERCEKVAELVTPSDEALVWCHLNDEGDLLEQVIPGARQISGQQSDEQKEELFTAFANGQISKLVTKPKIGAWGLNFQRCAHVATFPSHSYEQYYQGVRRCWRFGQKREVRVDIVTTEGDRPVLANQQRKAAQADRMFANLMAHMNNAMGVAKDRRFGASEVMPAWL
jgi:hypothetical protein